MKRKVLSAILSVAMVATMLVGCGSSAATTAPAETEAATTEAAAPAETEAAAATEAAAPAGEGGLIGVAMPTKDLQRWNQDGSNMEAQLKEAGYDVDLQYASNDIQTQVS